MIKIDTLRSIKIDGPGKGIIVPINPFTAGNRERRIAEGPHRGAVYNRTETSVASVDVGILLDRSGFGCRDDGRDWWNVGSRICGLSQSSQNKARENKKQHSCDACKYGPIRRTVHERTCS